MTAVPSPDDPGVAWFVTDDGRVVSRACRGARTQAPAGARPVTAEQAAARLAAIEVANADADARRDARSALEAESDYQSLIALGVPGRLASKLTGHRPGPRQGRQR